MPKGTVKWFNPARAMDSFNRKEAARIFLCTSRLLSGPASTVSMKGRSSSMRKCQTEAVPQPKISGLRGSRRGLLVWAVPRCVPFLIRAVAFHSPSTFSV